RPGIRLSSTSTSSKASVSACRLTKAWSLPSAIAASIHRLSCARCRAGRASSGRSRPFLRSSPASRSSARATCAAPSSITCAAVPENRRGFAKSWPNAKASRANSGCSSAFAPLSGTGKGGRQAAFFVACVTKKAACRPPFPVPERGANALLQPLFALLSFALGQLFANPRRFSGTAAQVIELGAAHVALALDLDAGDERRKGLERPL